MYADFESVLMKLPGCENDPNVSSTQKYQKHVPCGSCLYVVSSDQRFYQPPEVNFGCNAAEKFLDQVMAAAAKIRQTLEKKIPMIPLTREQWRHYHTASTCHICGKTFKGNFFYF